MPQADPPGSPSSTTATVPSGAGKPQIRKLVRPKEGWLTAVPVTEGQVVSLIDGRLKVGQTGQFLVQQGGQTLEIVSEAELQKRFDVQEMGGLHLSGEERRAIEDRLGVGCCQSGKTLVQAVRRIAALQIGTVEIPVTPGQWEEIQHRAKKNGRTTEQEVQQIAQRLEDELFHGGVGRGALGRL